MRIRDLDPRADRATVADLYARAADYVRLESGMEPDAAMVEAFFTDRPPGTGPAEKFGLFLDDATLAGIADLGLGFPAPDDAFLGLLLLDRDHRGRGLGHRLLADTVGRARTRGASRLLVAVLDANPRGRAFWEREGFRRELTRQDLPFGTKRHTVHRLALAL